MNVEDQPEESDDPGHDKEGPNQNEQEYKSYAETEGAYALPESNRSNFTGSPIGLRRGDENGLELIDAAAGSYSVWGFGDDSAAKAVMNASERLGHFWESNDPNDLQQLISQIDDRFRSAIAFSDKDLAIEAAILHARNRSQGQRYRTLSLVGSDHGRTGVARTASGLPELREGYGPMMSGFAQVPANDLEAVKHCIDDQTGCILLSPFELGHAARPLDADFISGVRRLCDQHDLLLAIDESAIVFGSCGALLATQSIVDVPIDLAIVADGLFSGLPGALLLSSSEDSDDSDDSDDSEAQDRSSGHPISNAVAQATIQSMVDRQAFDSANESSHQLAVQVAQAVAGYEFVRDVCPLGSSIGIETDIQSNLLIANASHFGLRLLAAGETGVRLALPLTIDETDLSELSQRMSETFEATEKQTAAVTL